jgi:hypothetical protein
MNDHPPSSLYVDKKGRRISVLEWSDLRDDPAYRTVVRRFVVPTLTEVFAVWVGVNAYPGAVFMLGVSQNGSPFRTVTTCDTEPDVIAAFHAVVREIWFHA